MAIKFVEMIVAQPPTHIKVSSVQEPCAKKLKSCKPYKKTFKVLASIDEKLKIKSLMFFVFYFLWIARFQSWTTMNLLQASCTEFTLPGANVNGAILCVAKRANFHTGTAFSKVGMGKNRFSCSNYQKSFANFEWIFGYFKKLLKEGYLEIRLRSISKISMN